MISGKIVSDYVKYLFTYYARRQSFTIFVNEIVSLCLSSDGQNRKEFNTGSPAGAHYYSLREARFPFGGNICRS